MNILLIGATGNLGRTLLPMAIAQGHHVTVYVRDQSKLPDDLNAEVTVVVGDVFDSETLTEACKQQDVVINTAGNVIDGERFLDVFKAVLQAVEAGLPSSGLFWFCGGAAALDIPGTDRMTVSLPKVPKLFVAHQTNYQRAKASTVNWSMLCTGPMIPASDGKPHKGLRISQDAWPVPRSKVNRYLPDIFSSLEFKRMMPALTISYEDAATVILNHLGLDSPLIGKRVGIALPVGMRQNKDIHALTQS